MHALRTVTRAVGGALTGVTSRLSKAKVQFFQRHMTITLSTDSTRKHLENLFLRLPDSCESTTLIGYRNFVLAKHPSLCGVGCFEDVLQEYFIINNPSMDDEHYENPGQILNDPMQIQWQDPRPFVESLLYKKL